MTTIRVDKWGFHLSITTKEIGKPTKFDLWKTTTLEEVIGELKAAAEMLEREQKKNGKNSGM